MEGEVCTHRFGLYYPLRRHDLQRYQRHSDWIHVRSFSLSRNAPDCADVRPDFKVLGGLSRRGSIASPVPYIQELAALWVRVIGWGLETTYDDYAVALTDISGWRTSSHRLHTSGRRAMPSSDEQQRSCVHKQLCSGLTLSFRKSHSE